MPTTHERYQQNRVFESDYTQLKYRSFTSEVICYFVEFEWLYYDLLYLNFYQLLIVYEHLGLLSEDELINFLHIEPIDALLRNRQLLQ